MKTRPNDCAFPQSVSTDGEDLYSTVDYRPDNVGLSKREWMATTIAAGMVSNPHIPELQVAKKALDIADQLIKKLNREELEFDPKEDEQDFGFKVSDYVKVIDESSEWHEYRGEIVGIDAAQNDGFNVYFDGDGYGWFALNQITSLKHG